MLALSVEKIIGKNTLRALLVAALPGRIDGTRLCHAAVLECKACANHSEVNAVVAAGQSHRCIRVLRAYQNY